MTTKRQIYLTEFDVQRLNDLLAELDTESRKQLTELERELDRAKLMDSRKIPANVVTMNTRLRYLDLEDNSDTDVTLVFPEDADIHQGKMSVFSPVGTALLGYAEGDILDWKTPGGTRRIRIEKILFQPEASGAFHL